MKSLTYTSLASFDLESDDLEAIHRSALELNALDGITGLLVFNGSRFLQIVEGEEAAVDELVERLRRDRRHSSLEVRAESEVEQRSFPDWSMELVKVSASYFEAKETLRAHIPSSVDERVREHLDRMTEGISKTVQFEPLPTMRPKWTD